jgi:hypothetical protein
MNDELRAKMNDLGVPRAADWEKLSDVNLEDIRREFSLDSPQSRYATLEQERRSGLRREKNERRLLVMTAVILIVTVLLAFR